ncbi:hypothetical protein ACLB2K_073874 [Fragaria x ananassa]
MKNVSIIDLVNTKKKNDEKANAFISRWRSLHVQCSDKLTEQSAIQICSNNLLLEITAFVSTAEPQTFDELVSKASNVERHVARKKIPIEMLFKSERADSTRDSLTIFVKTNETSNAYERNDMSRELTLKERKIFKYSFADEDVEEIFSVLYKENVIELPKLKHPSEVNKTKNSKFCRFHRIVGHPTSDCFVLKNVIQDMIDNKKIEVE